MFADDVPEPVLIRRSPFDDKRFTRLIGYLRWGNIVVAENPYLSKALRPRTHLTVEICWISKIVSESARFLGVKGLH